MAFPTPAARDDGRDGTSQANHTVSLTGLGTISSGDGLLLAVVDDGGDPIVFPSTGEVWTGFIDRRSAVSGSGHCRIAIAYRKATGGETTLTVETSGGGETVVWRLWRFASADIADWATDPPEGTDAEGGSVNNPNPPSHTVSWTAGEDNWWAALYGSDGNKRATAYPTSTTDTFTNGSLDTSGGACAIGVGERYATQLDTWDPSTFTMDGTDNTSVVTIAVRPAAAGDATVTPATIATTAALPAAGVGVTEPASTIATTVALPAATIDITSASTGMLSLLAAIT